MTENLLLTTKQQETRKAAMDFYATFRQQLMPAVAEEIPPVEPVVPPVLEVVKTRPTPVKPEAVPVVVADVPPQPDTTKFGAGSRRAEASVEFKLDRAIERLTPAAVDAETAKVVFDLQEGRKPVHCVRAGLTDDQLKFMWQPKIEAWWSGLGEPLREKFVAAAHRVTGNTVEDDMTARLTAGRMIGYRRLLDGIFARQPARLYDTYEAVKNGGDIFCPAGFTAAACEEWRGFLKTEWFSTISPDEKRRIDAIISRTKTIPGLMAKKERELGEKIQQLKKIDSIGAKFTRLFSSDKKIEQKGSSERRDELQREIAQLKLEVHECRVSRFIDEETAHADAQQHSIGDRAGFGARALDGARKLFAWIFSQEKTHAPQSLRGKVLGSLTGAYYNVPATVERWMVEAGCTQAAGSLGEHSQAVVENKTETARDLYDSHRTVGANGRPEIDWSAYLFALQRRITEEISRAVQKSQTLKIAYEREPLKGLLKAYQEAALKVAPGMRNQREQLTTLITQQLAEAEQDFRSRAGKRADRIHHLVAGKDLNWIDSILCEQQSADPNAPVQPSATPEHGADREQLGLRYAFIIGPEQSTVGAVRQVVAKFDPTKNPSALNRDTQQFLTTGWVFEAGDTSRKHLVAGNGVQTVPLYVGDRVTAVQDAAAPMGFHLEIVRNAPPQHEGYSAQDLRGKHDWYYQRVPNGTVHAWKVDAQGGKHFVGHFEGKKLIEHRERLWKYVGSDGSKHEVGEFKEDVFFKPDGTVVAKHQHRFTDLGKLPAAFAREVKITKKDGSQESLKLDSVGHTYFITPKNEVVEYHASVNQMRILGKII